MNSPSSSRGARTSKVLCIATSSQLQQAATHRPAIGTTRLPKPSSHKSLFFGPIFSIWPRQVSLLPGCKPTAKSRSPLPSGGPPWNLHLRAQAGGGHQKLPQLSDSVADGGQGCQHTPQPLHPHGGRQTAHRQNGQLHGESLIQFGRKGGGEGYGLGLQ